MGGFRNALRSLLNRELGQLASELDAATAELRALGERHALLLARFRVLQTKTNVRLSRAAGPLNEADLVDAVNRAALHQPNDAGRMPGKEGEDDDIRFPRH